ncbi:MAG: lytic transglycosylase domain-containing protein [Candidatus Rehaiarchaeum fermentans]|nr:lytic transglycosylase domain-containing protein [Candidatus Rehaiarchaeum fermentans]
MKVLALLILGIIVYYIYEKYYNKSNITSPFFTGINNLINSAGNAISTAANTLSSKAQDYLSDINTVSQEYGINPAILFAITATEQGTTNMADWNPDAYNPTDPSGAFGLTQVLSDTAAELGVNNPNDLFNPLTALETTAKYILKYSPDPNDIVTTAQVYNAGSNADFVDTNYINKALQNYEYYYEHY